MEAIVCNWKKWRWNVKRPEEESLAGNVSGQTLLHPASAEGVIVLTSCVCVCVCVCVCPSVRLTILAEWTDIQTWTLACRSGLSISRMSSNVKVIGQRSRSWPYNRSHLSMYTIDLEKATDRDDINRWEMKWSRQQDQLMLLGVKGVINTTKEWSS